MSLPTSAPVVDQHQFVRFQTLSAESCQYTQSSTGFKSTFQDWIVPGEELWIMYTAVMTTLTAFSTLTASTDRVGYHDFQRFDLNQSDGTVDIFKRPVAPGHRFHFLWYQAPVANFAMIANAPIPAQGMVCPPNTRIMLAASMFDTTIPPVVPTITSRALIDVAVYRRIGTDGQVQSGGNGPMFYTEWWK